jgi:hypothetical protein
MALLGMHEITSLPTPAAIVTSIFAHSVQLRPQKSFQQAATTSQLNLAHEMKFICYS